MPSIGSTTHTLRCLSRSGSSSFGMTEWGVASTPELLTAMGVDPASVVCADDPGATGDASVVSCDASQQP